MPQDKNTIKVAVDRADKAEDKIEELKVELQRAKEDEKYEKETAEEVGKTRRYTRERRYRGGWGGRGGEGVRAE